MKYAWSISLVLAAAACAALTVPAQAGPAYDHDRKELESILEDLMAWLPGEWSNAPQQHYEHTVKMPAEGEHEPWYRTFARIEAPQIGPYVFYGQINLGGRDGPLYQRSQVIYKASIDEARGVVLVRGQALANADRFVNLQDRPELWKQVSMREDDVRCDFIWRRDGEQIVGVLEGRTEERRKGGPGTCTYQASGGREFFADAEWTLTPETLWLYDTNLMDGKLFIGRNDRTHTKLYRASPYTCTVQDAAGTRSIAAHDRGASGELKLKGDQVQQWKLLRARYPAKDGFGLDEQLRLTFGKPDSYDAVATESADPRATRIALQHSGARVECVRATKFGPMP